MELALQQGLDQCGLVGVKAELDLLQEGRPTP